MRARRGVWSDVQHAARLPGSRPAVPKSRLSQKTQPATTQSSRPPKADLQKSRCAPGVRLSWQRAPRRSLATACAALRPKNQGALGQGGARCPPGCAPSRAPHQGGARRQPAAPASAACPTPQVTGVGEQKLRERKREEPARAAPAVRPAAGARARRPRGELRGPAAARPAAAACRSEGVAVRSEGVAVALGRHAPATGGRAAAAAARQAGRRLRARACVWRRARAHARAPTAHRTA